MGYSPAFYPPRHNTLLINLLRGLGLPLLLRLWDKITAVEIDADARRTLEALGDQRVVLCPNHPSRCDSDVMFAASGLLRRQWSYMAAREVFDPAWQGWLLSSLGVYSVIRGTRDSEAFRTTRQLIADGQRWVVLFPEGETSGRNDQVMPFQPGVVQFACWALEDLAAQGAPPPVYLVPVAVKYTYPTDMRRTMTRALARLERTLGLPTTDGDLYARLRRIGETVLATSEREYGVRPDPDAALDARVQAMKELIVSRVAADLEVTLNPAQPLLERIRLLFNAADRLTKDAPADSAYARQVQQGRQEHIRSLYHALWRVLRFVATYEGYVRETMTVERFMETLLRLEWEVYGKVRWHGPRVVRLYTGEPINLAEHWPAYRQDKRATVADLTALLEQRVQEKLDALVAQGAPLPPA